MSPNEPDDDDWANPDRDSSEPHYDYLQGKWVYGQEDDADEEEEDPEDE